MPELGSALVGTGFIGPVHLEACGGWAGKSSASSLDPGKKQGGASAWNIPKAYNRYEDLLADPMSRWSISLRQTGITSNNASWL